MPRANFFDDRGCITFCTTEQKTFEMRGLAVNGKFVESEISMLPVNINSIMVTKSPENIIDMLLM